MILSPDHIKFNPNLRTEPGCPHSNFRSDAQVPSGLRTSAYSLGARMEVMCISPWVKAVRLAVGDLFLVFWGLGEFISDWPLRKHKG